MYPFISIIIPVFNSVRYVVTTLDTILTQSYKDYEIILIDDGSKDDSAAVCKQYAKTNQCITFISKKNEGVAITRNKALDIARGEYIFFVDSDDIVYPGTLADVVSALKDFAPDFLRYDFNTIDENGCNLYPNRLRKKRERYCYKDLPPAEFMEKVILGEYFLCMHVFKNSIISENNIRFIEGCTYNEDTLFIIQYLQHCEKCIYSDALFYGYRKYSGAVTARFTEKNFRDVIDVFMNIVAMMPRESKLHDAVKGVVEMLGRRLMEHSVEFDSVGRIAEVRKICLSDAVTSDWKLFRLFGTEKVWKVLDLYRKIVQRLM